MVHKSVQPRADETMESKHGHPTRYECYSAMMYTFSYLMKKDKGMGEVLRRVAEEVDNGTATYRDKLNKVGHAFMGAREVSAQEAVMRILSISLVKDTKVIFVSNGMKEERVQMLQWDIQQLEDNDEDVFENSIHDLYALCPQEVENMSLADFATTYQRDRGGKSSKEDQSEEMVAGATAAGTDYDEEDDNEKNTTNGSSYEDRPKLINIRTSKSIVVMKKRKSPAVIRTLRVKDKQPEKFYFGKLLMFHPWRIEKDLQKNPKELYEEHQETIEENALQYTLHEEQEDRAFEQLEKEGDPDILDVVASAIAEDNAAAQEENVEYLTGLDAKEAEEDERNEEENNRTSGTLTELYRKEAQKNVLTNAEYNKHFHQCNDDQKRVVLFNRAWCKRRL